MAISTTTKIAIGVGLGCAAWALKRRKKLETKIFNLHGRDVLVHVPSTFASTRVLFYFHGNGATLENVSALIPIFDSAKRPPIVVVPQLASNGNPGDLANDNVAANMLRAVSASIGSGSFDPASTQVDVACHSGGYLAASAVLRRGGIQSSVKNVALLDALYGNASVFEAFALSSQTKRFINVFGPSTVSQSIDLSHRLMAARPEETYFNGEGSAGNGDPILTEALRHPISTIRTIAQHGLVPSRYIQPILNAFA